MNAGKLAIGAVLAIATGAVVGVLFAPDKGSTTRKRLSRRGSRYMGALKEGASEYVDTIEEGIDGIKETFVRITD